LKGGKKNHMLKSLVPKKEIRRGDGGRTLENHKGGADLAKGLLRVEKERKAQQWEKSMTNVPSGYKHTVLLEGVIL